MSAVPSAPASTRNTWTCPTCKHGSPDPRDELAHLDAHRQLGRFLEEWDAAVVSDRKKEQRGRPTALILAALVGLVALVAGVTFWGFDHLGGSSAPVAGPVRGPVPIVPAPAPPPPPGLTQPAPEPPAPAQQAPEASAPTPTATRLTPPAPSQAPSQAAPQAPARTAAAAPSGDPTGAGATVVPVPAPPAPSDVAGPQTARTGALIPPPAYLLQVCVFNTCLTIP